MFVYSVYIYIYTYSTTFHKDLCENLHCQLAKNLYSISTLVDKLSQASIPPQVCELHAEPARHGPLGPPKLCVPEDWFLPCFPELLNCYVCFYVFQS